MKIRSDDFISYPRTFHLMSSPGRSSDDKVLKSHEDLKRSKVVVLEKMDGENTNMYRSGIHARSLDFSYHESRSWVQRLHAGISWRIPEGFRICGENVYAKHSIRYSNLPGYFIVFSIWDADNNCLSWEDTVAMAEELGLPVVNCLYQGEYSDSVIEDIVSGLDTNEVEGIVVRPLESFSYDEFSTRVGKWVRESHVQTDKHWRFQKIVKNELAVK